jgi:hypothetical protein
MTRKERIYTDKVCDPPCTPRRTSRMGNCCIIAQMMGTTGDSPLAFCLPLLPFVFKETTLCPACI